MPPETKRVRRKACRYETKSGHHISCCFKLLQRALERHIRPDSISGLDVAFCRAQLYVRRTVEKRKGVAARCSKHFGHKQRVKEWNAIHIKQAL